MKKTGIVLCVIAALGTCFWVWINTPSEDHETTQSHTMQASRTVSGLNKSTSTILPTITEPDKPFIVNSTTCEAFEINANTIMREHFRSYSPEDYLQEGFSVDDVTVLLDSRHTNQAIMWRDQTRLQESELDTINQYIHEFIKEHFPELLTSFDVMGGKASLNTERRAAPDWLRKAVKQGEQFEVPIWDEMLPDDVAWLIKQNDVADKAIKQAVMLLDDINATISVDGSIRNEVNILDAALREGRSDLGFWLLSMNAEPLQDDYTGGALDNGLYGLEKLYGAYRGHESEDALSKLQMQVRLIDELASLGQFAHAGIEIRFDGEEGYASYRGVRNPYFISIDEINGISELTGLNVIGLPAANRMASPRGEELLALDRERLDSRLNEVNDGQFNSRMTSCVQFARNLENSWSPEHFSGIRNSSLSDFELFALAPELVACRRKERHTWHVLHHPYAEKEGGRAFSRILDDDPGKAQEMLFGEPAAIDYTFYAVLEYKADALSGLLNVGLVPEQLDYSARFNASFSLLAEQGFDLYQLDKYGRSLLYVAAAAWLPEQMTYLSEREVPY
ncbi:hypothetical protein [Alteromonas confluentis]|uniref:Uncharacterized protein n=1 Tax=Alteromonas confluentis TaxID=1656094 RepID=A0A1E7ZG06_9ALTE|nr:hypothetical protein [Alteromonas confluentis]OFC72436.1 hypothetical protein BFC18_02400 [Alteromonas confluentis]